MLPRIIKDHLGSIRVTLDQSGNIDSWTDYYPFGKEARGSNTLNEPREGFTGHQHDAEPDLDYMGARYNNPSIARLATVDPLHQFATPYVYVGNNPIILVDPNGKAAIDYNGFNWAAADRDFEEAGGSKTTNQNQSTSPDKSSADESAVPDGYLTWTQAKHHYQFGGGKPVFVDLDKLDLSNVSLVDFDASGKAKVRLDGKHFANIDDALVHGTIILERVENTNDVQVAYKDEVRGRGELYNFEMHPWNTLENVIYRNPITFVGGIINGTSFMTTAAAGPSTVPIYTGGTPFPIYFRGTATIKP